MRKPDSANGLAGFGRSGRRNGIDTKVAVAAGKATLGKQPSQKIIGKLAGMQAMPGGGDASKGGPIKTVSSNPIQGKTASTGSVMGSGGVIDGFA